MASDLAREALAPEGVLPLRVNEMTPSVIICAEGSRISIQWREQRPDQPDHDEYGRAEAMAAFLVEAANRHGAAYDAMGSRVKALIERARVATNSAVFSDEDPQAVVDWAEEAALLLGDFMAALSTHTAAGAGPVGEAVAFEFDRYIDGTLMAEGVKIERQPTLEKAAMRAAQIASHGLNSEVPVLVLRSSATARTVEEPGEVERDPYPRVAAENMRLREEVERLTRERDEARAELAAYQHKQEHEAFKGLMTGPDPARVWKQQAVQFAHNLDAAEAALDVERKLRAVLTGDAQEAGR